MIKCAGEVSHFFPQSRFEEHDDKFGEALGMFEARVFPFRVQFSRSPPVGST